MTETTYFWQGGRKIEVQQDDAAVIIHAESAAAARDAAHLAGVELHNVEATAPGLVRARIAGDRDRAMGLLREQRHVVHHIYQDRQAPRNEYLITESFFIKFKPDTPEHHIREYFAAERLVVQQDLGNKTYLVQVTDATGRNPIRTANAAVTRNDVEYAEPNLVRRLTRFAFIPADTEFSVVSLN